MLCFLGTKTNIPILKVLQAMSTDLLPVTAVDFVRRSSETSLIVGDM